MSSFNGTFSKSRKSASGSYVSPWSPFDYRLGFGIFVREDAPEEHLLRLLPT
jgi:hypothetical protein